MRGRKIVVSLGLLLMLACTAAFAQNPIQNPSFELGTDGLQGWTAYSYGSGQVTAVNPMVGTVGAGGTFNVLFPDQGASDGTKVCGIQGWYDAMSGGVYQKFTAPGPGYIVIAARAYTQAVNPDEVKDFGARVRAAAVPGDVTDRTKVPWTGPNAWKPCAWSANYNDIALQVASAGTYTLFIENNITWDNCVYSTIWDNIRWAEGTVTILEDKQPYVSNITETSATVTWDTDKEGTSVVEYDLDGPPYAASASGPSGTHHVVTLTGLTPGATYRFSARTDAAPLPSVSSPDAKFSTAPTAVDQFANGDFEAKDGNGNPTFAPWVKFGNFDGLIANNTQAALAHGGEYMTGAVAASDNSKNWSGCMQRVKVKPGASYVVKAWIWTEGNLEYPPTSGNTAEGWNTAARIGIDPTGSVDLWYVDPTTGQPTYDVNQGKLQDNPSITWSPWDFTQDYNIPYAQLGYKQISSVVQIPDNCNVATVYLQVKQMWPQALNRTVIDDVQFVEEVAVDSISKAKLAPANWVVDLNNNGQGYIVTRSELIPGNGTLEPIVWIQEDDRSAGMKINLGTLENGSEVYAGDRITVKGRTKRLTLNGTKWAETEIAAEQFSKISSNNTVPQPIAMGCKAVGGADLGIVRGATNGVGTNNVGLLVKVVGRVTAIDPNDDGYSSYTIKIDDGSGVKVAVYHPDDPFTRTSMPAVGTLVSAVGVSGLMINDPTLNTENLPNGSGDETAMPTVMLRDGRDLEIIPE